MKTFFKNKSINFDIDMGIFRNKRDTKLKHKTSVLFVCMGNICRSPTAEGVFRKQIYDQGLSKYFRIESAGTITHHSGERPDPRAQSSAQKKGYDLSKIKARKVRTKDFADFDYILAMDKENLQYLLEEAPQEFHYKIRLFLDYGTNLEVEEVPDPYYGSLGGFDRVIELIENASHGLLRKIESSSQ